MEKKPKVEKIPKIPKEKKPKKEVKRKMNRFPIPEEEIAKRGLPDYLKEGLDMVFIGINPSMAAAYSGKYYDGGGNHFWPALYLSKLIPEPMNPQDDYKLMDMGIGFTNIVPRTTRGIADLSKQEIADGAKVCAVSLCIHCVKYISLCRCCFGLETTKGNHQNFDPSLQSTQETLT